MPIVNKERRFRIHLDEAHRKSGLTVYAVAKRLGLNQNTVRKYITPGMECDLIAPDVLLLAAFYGVNLKDAIDVIEVDEENSTNLLAVGISTWP